MDNMDESVIKSFIYTFHDSFPSVDRIQMYNFTYLGNSICPRGWVCTTELWEKFSYSKQWSDPEYPQDDVLVMNNIRYR